MTAPAAAWRQVANRALPPTRARGMGVALGVLADACVVGLLGLSLWLIVSAAEQPPILHLTFAIVGVRALAIGRAALRYAHRLSAHDAVLTQLTPLRVDTFERLIPRVPGAWPTRRRGELLAAFVDDVDRLQDEEVRVRGPLMTSGIVTILSLLVIAVITPVAGLVLGASLALFGATAVLWARRAAARSDADIAAAKGRLSDALLERVTSAETLAAFDAVGQSRRRIEDAERRVARAQLRRARSAGIEGSVLALGSGVATLTMLLVLVPEAGLSAPLSAPLFAAITIVPAAVFEVFAQVPGAVAARRAVRASAERVATYTEGALPPEIPVDRVDDGAHADDRTAGSAARRPGIDLRIRDLAVRYPGTGRPAISGVTFTLPAGESLVVRGASGAGKSTLALALTRFLEYEGSYTLGESGSAPVEANTCSISKVRSRVGLCEQQPHLFDSDLRQNLAFANDSATDDELWAAIERVGLAEWAGTRGGLDAMVGDRGALVSGGQAQRIALARVLLADFPVIILDEPTAGVDAPLADALLRDLLGAIPANRSVLVITHTRMPVGLERATITL